MNLFCASINIIINNILILSLMVLMMGFCAFKFFKKAPHRYLLVMAGLCVPLGFICHCIFFMTPSTLSSTGEVQEPFYLLILGFLLYMIGLGLLAFWFALRAVIRIFAWSKNYLTVAAAQS